MFEIGHSLRAARERQGLAFPEIELATKIRAKYIRALEEEDFDVLPSDTYLRGFLRTYADYLGLDGEIYVQEYASRFITSWRDDLPEPSDRRRARRELRVERRAVVFVLVGIAVLTALVFAAWRYGGSKAPVPGLGTQQHAAHLSLRGVGTGTFVVVRRGTASGAVLFQGTIAGGHVQRFDGRRFYVRARRWTRLRVAQVSAGVTLVRSSG